MQLSWIDEEMALCLIQMYDHTVDLYSLPVITQKVTTTAIGKRPLKRLQNKGTSRYGDEMTSANGNGNRVSKDKGCERNAHR